ncbi:MAG: 1-hydroxycarotenoid 3,4-desaturase CrtD [Bacteroidota bacterium]
MKSKKAIIVGAGIGGLATAIRLRHKGFEVSVFEASYKAGGKLNQMEEKGYRFDMGPSLFTLPQELDAIFSFVGKNPRDYYEYEKLELITKYFYEDGTQIDAWAEPHRFAAEIEDKTKESKEKALKVLKKSEEIYDITAHVFLERSLHKLSTYLRKDTLISILNLHRIDSMRSMHKANAHQFKDPRVVQLFDRYATYNGSNPYEAPATLRIIPHLEFNIGAYFPKKGIYSIPSALYQLAKDIGVNFHFGKKVEEILVSEGKAQGIKIAGEDYPAEVVVSNMDVVPTYRKLLSHQKAPEKILSQPRSSSALIFYWGIKASFPQLDLHNIFFSEDYQEEFRQIWEEKGIYHDPTIYVHISSKCEAEDAPQGCENWFVMINVPANQGQDWESLIVNARARILSKLSRMLKQDIEPLIEFEDKLTPELIESRTSSYQGALYGNSSNNKFAAFLRHPNFHRKIKGLYFVGGSVHPGGGIPLCLLSARIVGDLVGG